MEKLDSFIQECKAKNYDNYEIKEKLKEHLQSKGYTKVDFRVWKYRVMLSYVYSEVVR